METTQIAKTLEKEGYKVAVLEKKFIVVDHKTKCRSKYQVRPAPKQKVWYQSKLQRIHQHNNGDLH